MQALGGDQWEVLEMPALSDAGEALWPEWFDAATLERIKGAVGPREWSALYQQRPQPEEGTFFQRDWFDLCAPNHHPAKLHIYATSDYAVTEGDGDWTELAVWGVDADGDIWQLDWWSGQTTADVWIDAELALVRRWNPFAWFSEGGTIRRAVEPFQVRRARSRNIHVRREWLQVAGLGDKPTRARSFQAMAASGKVHLLDDERGHSLLDQLLRFPAGKHDDKVDCCSLMGLALDQAHPAIVQRQEKAKRRDSWDSSWDDSDEASWKVA